MTDDEIRGHLKSRLQAVEVRIQTACDRAGRSRSEVTLLAVTKTVGIRVAGILLELGVPHLAESRPQEFWRKVEALKNPDLHWHLIGHLQRNKIDRCVSYQPMLIHSVDSVRLLHALEAEAKKQKRTLSILLEVNASREENKQGFPPEQIPGLQDEISRCSALQLEGLMTMAAFDVEPEQCRNTFQEVRLLRDRLQDTWRLPLPRLSMGMSNDFEVAIEEGATLIRLGTILFEGLQEDTQSA